MFEFSYFIRRLLRLFAGSLLALSLFMGSVGPTRAGTTGTISGTLTDEKTGAPIAGATVAAVAPIGDFHTKTDAKGFFSLTGVSPDTYRVSFEAPGYQPAALTGITVSADQVADVSTKIQHSLTTIGRVTARSAGGAYQPAQTQDTYTVTSQQIQTALGRADAVSESNLLVSLPGATYDSSGYPVLRGGRENEEGFQDEGIDYTDAFLSQFVNSLSLNPGVSSLQLTPGAGDASSGNAGTGTINLISKRGSYPGFASVQGTVQSPAYQHQLGVEFGIATRDGSLSNYVSFEGIRQAGRTYGRNADARTIGRFFTTTDEVGNDLTDNLIFRFGKSKSQSVQLFAEVQQSNFLNTYGDTSSLYYKSNDAFWLANEEANTGLSVAQIQGLLPLDPYQPSITSKLTRSPYASYQPNNTYKLEYNNNLNASTFLALRAYRTDAVSTFDIPFNETNFVYADQYAKQGGQRSGAALDLTKALGTKNLIKVGGKYEFLHPVEDFDDPYDGVFITTLYGNSGDFLPNNAACPYAACGYLNSQGIAKPGAIPGFVENTSTNRQDWATYLTDTYSPTTKTKVEGGLRIEGSNNRFASTDSQYYAPAALGPNGFPLAANGKEISADTQAYVINVPKDALHPLVLEPRLAISQQLGPNDAIRASYGRSVEFASLGYVDYGTDRTSYNSFGGVKSNAPVCGVTGNLTCRNYADQLFWEEQSNLGGVPYQPIAPATFTNFDFSYSHEFSGNIGLKITPFYRRGYAVSALVANPRLGANGQPLLDPDGNVLFGPTTATNDGIERTTGLELLLTREAPFGFSGQISATYINEVSNVIPNSTNEDFFPSIPSQSLALGNQYRVGFLSPFQATAAIQYKTHGGFRINPQIYYIRGYPIGEGRLTSAYINGKPYNLPNTNVTDTNGASSATSYVDPQNPGSLLAPNIAATRGTAEGNSAGGVIGKAAVFTNVSLEYSPPGSHSTFGVQVLNLFGNIYDNFGSGNTIVGNTRYQPVATGISGPLSGYNGVFSTFPSLGGAPYLGAAENGQQPYLVRPRYQAQQYQFYYNVHV